MLAALLLTALLLTTLLLATLLLATILRLALAGLLLLLLLLRLRLAVQLWLICLRNVLQAVGSANIDLHFRALEFLLPVAAAAALGAEADSS